MLWFEVRDPSRYVIVVFRVKSYSPSPNQAAKLYLAGSDRA